MAFENLPQKVLEASKKHLTVVKNEQDMLYYKEWLSNPAKWRIPAVSLDTFLNNKLYLGLGDMVYPVIRQTANEIINGKFKEGVILAGIGAGKTTISEILACYITHILLCKRDPFRQYGLAKDKPITIMNMGTTATQALEVCFAGIRKFIQESIWFKRFHPSIIQGKIKFLDENIMLISGNSKSTTPLGYNVFCAILDEAAFYIDNDNKQVAKDIYTSLQRRVVSRFGNDGLVMMVSSPKYEDDFIMQKINEAKKNPKVVYWKQMPTWKSKPLKNADLDNCFYFDHEKSEIVDVDVVKNKKNINFVFSSNFGTEYKIWQIPGEYKSSFKQDSDKAKRDYAAMPSRTIEGFFKHRNIVERIFDERRNPVIKDFGIIRYEFAEAPLRTEYFIHIDLALNRGGTGDKAGFAMGHCAGMRKDDMTGEEKKLIVIDLVERIGAGVIGEIDFEDIRNKIYTLKSIGYNIRLISLDGYQCLLKGTKIPVITLDDFQRKLYNKDININKKSMSLLSKSKVELLKGIDKNIEDIKAGEYVYSINKEGNIGFGKVKNIWCAGKKEIFRVHLDNGKYIDCSDNHPFMLRNGKFKQVKNLKVGDSLMPLYRKTKRMNTINHCYEMILHPSGEWEYTHRAIVRQKNEKNEVIHHIDRNKFNNCPTNLEAITNKNHLKKHQKDAQKKRWEKPEQREKLSKLASARNKLKPPRLGTKTSLIGRKNISDEVKKLWQNDEYKKMMMKRKTAHYGEEHPAYDKRITFELLKNYRNFSLQETCKKLNTTQGVINRRIKKQGFNSWREFCKTKNHKVVKVEKLNIKDETWDIEVEDNHNFATSAGVFVHNSAEFFVILKKKGYKAEYLSVDRTTEPYDMLKCVMNEDRLRVHKQPKLLSELLGLELVKSGKIDHPPSGSKDLADSVAGTVFNVLKYGGSGIGMKAIKYYGNIEAVPTDPALMTHAQKTEYYTKLQKLIDDGMLGY